MDFENYVSFEYFKKIFLYEQKYLLDDKTIYVDTFEKGDYCEPIKAQRRVIIYYTCEEERLYELKLNKVFEDKKIYVFIIFMPKVNIYVITIYL